MRDTIIKAAVLCCSLLTVIGLQNADAALMNVDFKNSTGNVASDYHLKLVSSNPINISNTYRFGGDVVFNPPTITGSGSNNLSLDFAGATVNNGQTTHIGFYAPGNFDIKVAESFWTFGNLEVLPRIGMKSVAFNGASTDFLVERINLFSDLAGSNLVGTMWWEDQAASLRNFNYTTEPVFASFATLRSQNMIPLENLNHSLSGFGSESQIQYFAPVPEPSTLLLVGFGLAGFAIRRHLKAGRKAVSK